MSNYTPSNIPLGGARGVASVIRNEFQLIADAIDTKIDSVGGTAETPPPTDVSDRVATTQFVDTANQNVIAYMNSLVSGGTHYAGVWSTLTGALNRPATAYHSGRLWWLQNDLANVTTSEPGAPPYTDWSDITPVSMANLHAYALYFED